jgi:hypothetical protein
VGRLWVCPHLSKLFKLFNGARTLSIPDCDSSLHLHLRRNAVVSFSAGDALGHRPSAIGHELKQHRSDTPGARATGPHHGRFPRNSPEALTGRLVRQPGDLAGPAIRRTVDAPCSRTTSPLPNRQQSRGLLGLIRIVCMMTADIVILISMCSLGRPGDRGIEGCRSSSPDHRRNGRCETKAGRRQAVQPPSEQNAEFRTREMGIGLWQMRRLAVSVQP